MLRLPHRSTLFPYTTLFRSELCNVELRERLRGRLRFRAEDGSRCHVRFGEDAAVFPETDVAARTDRKSTRLNSSHANISYAVFCLKKKRETRQADRRS